jgi:hypothetical protein
MTDKYGEVIIHIGRHKSGTTSIQHELHVQENLLSSYGALYSKVGRSRSGFANHTLAVACQQLDFELLKKFKVQIEQELRSTHQLIFSSEGFQNLKDPSILLDLFPFGVRKKVVVYLRDVVSYLATSYAQRIQSSDLISGFAEYALNRKVDYQRFVEKWITLSDSIIIRLFDPRYLVGGDAVVDFFSILDIAPDSDGTFRSHLNPSVGGNLLFAKLLLNRLPMAFDRSNAYNSLSNLALQSDRFQSGFWICDSLVETLRAENSSNYSFLKQEFGYEETTSFATRPLAPDATTIREDLIYLSSFPGLENLKILQNLDGNHFGRQVGSP